MSKWINKTTVQLTAGGTNNTGSTSTVNFAAANVGNLLVAVASGSVTSTLPTGWTLGTSAVGSTGTYVWWKLAAAGESSFTTTHNGSGYPNGYVVYEFPAGSRFVTGTGTGGLATGTANPTISSLTGTNLLFASVSESYPYTTFNGTGITWPAGTTVDTDIHAAHVSTDGYWLGIGYAEDSTATSYGPNPTISDPNGTVASERLTWAIHVNPTITKVATATAQFGATGTNNLTVPAGVTSNHLAVVMVADANIYSDTDTVTAPAGWTTQANKPVAANNSSVSIFTKLGGYSAGQTIPFTTNSGAIWAVYAVWYDTQGYDIGIVGTGGGRSGTSSAITTVPGITTTDANQDVIVVATERTLTTGTTVSASGFTPTVDLYTEDPAASSNTATSGYFAHYTKTTAGATGNLTLTYNNASGNGFGMMFGIQTPKTAPVKIVGTPTTTDVSGTSATTTSVTVPGGAKVGEILLATLLSGGAGGLMTAPSGWTPVKTYSDASKNSVQVAYRVVDGTEATSYAWTHGSTTLRTFTLSRISGTNTAAPVRASASLDPGTQGQTETGPSLTGVQSTDQTFYFFTSGDANSTTQASTPTITTSGWTTDLARVNTQESVVLAHANALGAVAAPTVSGSATTLIWSSVGLALEPYGAAASTKTATFVDNFTTQSSTNWTGYGTGASVVSGQLQLTVATAYYGITTNNNYDLTNSSITAQLLGVPNVGNGTTETFLIYGPDSNNKVQWGWGNGFLNAQAIVNGNYTSIGTSLAYNATTMKWLRIRHDGTKVQWDYSADALTWTTVGSGWTPTTGFFVNNSSIRIFAGYYGTETTPGTAIWDNVNYTPTLAVETWNGADNAAWPSQWTTAGAGVGKVQITGNRGQLTSNNTATFNSGDYAKLTNLSVADLEATVDFQFAADNDQYLAFQLRSAGAAVNLAPSAGYQFFVTQTQATINAANPTQANSGTPITGSAVNYHAGTTPTRLRMRCVGTTLQYKIWPSANAEPASWTATVTDSTYTAAGAFGISMASGNSLASQTVYLDNLTITDGSITSNQTVIPAFKVLQRGKAALASAATSLTVSLPGAATLGTTQVVVLTTSSGAGIGTLPAGWTNRASRTDRLNNLYILDHATTATTDTSVTFTFPNGAANAYIMEAQGIIAPDTVAGTGGAGPSASYTTGTLTPTIANTWLLVGTDYTTNTSTAFSAPVAFRDQQYTSIATFSNIHSAYADGTIASFSPQTVTITPTASASDWETVMITYEITAPASTGLLDTVYNGTTEVPATLTIYNGATEIAVVKQERMPSGISVTNMSSSTYQPFFVAHRGGSADWAEHSMRANTQSVYLKMDAIEISLARTSDGVYFGLHDQTLNRTSPSAPASYDPSLHTWAEVSAFQCNAPSGGDATFGAQNYLKLQDALGAYARSHVIFIDPKYISSSNYTELLNIMDAYGGTDRFIAKFAGGGEQWSVAAKARGYKAWGYFYMTDVDAGQPTTAIANKYDFLGMEYNAGASYWTTIKSFGKPVIAHIAPDAAGAASGISQGAVGVMVSGVRNVMASYRP